MDGLPQVYAGKIHDYPGSRPSAIHKTPIAGTLMLTDTGIAGDQQAEPGTHGGPDRALCHYPSEHYASWAQAFPAQAHAFRPAAFGENISTQGLTEHDVHIGDIYSWDGALIQVTQPRSPCYKLNFHLGIADFAEQMQRVGRCGWLYRVIAAGPVSSAAPLRLASRLSDVSVAEAIAIAWHTPFDETAYQRLLSAAGLSASWTRTLQRRCLSGQLEDNSKRLRGAAASKQTGS
ncbi:MAG: 6-hydroxyaminopurine reductase [Rhodocyclaceae bacterium]